MDLSSLVIKVRNNLSDIPDNYITDDAVFEDLERSEKFIDLIKVSSATEDALDTAKIMLASYYSYMTWTTLSEAHFGDIPISMINKAVHQRSMARAFLQLISKYPITEDLTVDPYKIKGAVQYGRLSTTLFD
ncbi:MAG: hypothetical protein D4S01_10265 [Dehalococcoidia bacterium]|nr:MAG: hypothetical protein D4S01_10265 [Dehalococcoidia bacterium]